MAAKSAAQIIADGLALSFKGGIKPNSWKAEDFYPVAKDFVRWVGEGGYSLVRTRDKSLEIKESELLDEAITHLQYVLDHGRTAPGGEQSHNSVHIEDFVQRYIALRKGRPSVKTQLISDWPVGKRVIVSGGNLYIMGTIFQHDDDGCPWVLADDGVYYSCRDVSVRDFNPKYDKALRRKQAPKCYRYADKKFCLQPGKNKGLCNEHAGVPRISLGR